MIATKNGTSAAQATTYKDSRATSKKSNVKDARPKKTGGRYRFKSNVNGAQLELAAMSKSRDSL